MANAFQFELVSPEKMLVSKPTVMVTVPGTEGDFGVLIGHAPFISTLRPGLIDIYENDESVISERIFVAGGFAEVTAERCTVLAEEASPLSALDRLVLEQHEKRLMDEILVATIDEEREDIAERLNVVRAKLTALQAMPQH